MMSPSSGLQGEIDDCLTKTCLPKEEDPLSYWKCNASKYPSLAKLPPNFLNIPASSAPVERLFSVLSCTSIWMFIPYEHVYLLINKHVYLTCAYMNKVSEKVFVFEILLSVFVLK